MFLIFVLLFIIITAFCIFLFVKKFKKKDNKYSMVIVCYIIFIFLFICSGYFVLEQYTVMQSKVVEELDKKQSFFESVDSEILDKEKYIYEVDDYNKLVSNYYTFVLASQGYKGNNIYWLLAGPFNTIVFKDYEREYKKFEVVNIQYQIVEKDW